MKVVIASLALLLTCLPASCEPLKATVNKSSVTAFRSVPPMFEPQNPVFDISEFRKMPPSILPELEIGIPQPPVHRKIIIDWYPWHCQFSRLLERNWQPLYDSMGNFPIRSNNQGVLQITFTPLGLYSVELVKSSGSPELDEFERRLYSICGSSLSLGYPARSHRGTYSYLIPFQMTGPLNSTMTFQQVTPMRDIEVYYE